MTHLAAFVHERAAAARRAARIAPEDRCGSCWGAGTLADAPGSGLPTPVLPGLWTLGDPILEPASDPYDCHACAGTGRHTFRPIRNETCPRCGREFPSESPAHLDGLDLPEWCGCTEAETAYADAVDDYLATRDHTDEAAP